MDTTCKHWDSETAKCKLKNPDRPGSLRALESKRCAHPYPWKDKNKECKSLKIEIVCV